MDLVNIATVACFLMINPFASFFFYADECHLSAAPCWAFLLPAVMTQSAYYEQWRRSFTLLKIIIQSCKSTIIIHVYVIIIFILYKILLKEKYVILIRKMYVDY